MEINSIYEGDNLEILSKFPSKSIDLIYADPPFFSNRQYEIIWDDGAEIRAFQDRWKGGIEHYVAWMEPRLQECHRLLKDSGSIYLHCDWHASAHLKILMDKIFGENNFRNEIIWCYKRWTAVSNRFQKLHDTLLFYSRSQNNIWNQPLVPYDDAEAHYTEKDSKGEFRWQYLDGKKYKLYKKEGVKMGDWWEINYLNSMAKERLGYPTQKPLALLDIIVKASSNKGDVVLDPFCGCGTTLCAAQKLGRKWIGIDVSPTACKLMKKRLQSSFGFAAHIIRGEVDLKYLKKLQPFDFQNWVVVDKFLGKVSDRKSGDMGVDGFTPQIDGGYPIQVKQSEGVGRNVIDNFETAMRRMKKTTGYIVAFSFAKGAYEEAARVKNQENIEIILRTVEELLNGKAE